MPTTSTHYSLSRKFFFIKMHLKEIFHLISIQLKLVNVYVLWKLCKLIILMHIRHQDDEYVDVVKKIIKIAPSLKFNWNDFFLLYHVFIINIHVQYVGTEFFDRWQIYIKIEIHACSFRVNLKIYLHLASYHEK